MERWVNVGLLLGQRRRRWANSKPTLTQRSMFAGTIRSTIKKNLHLTVTMTSSTILYTSDGENCNIQHIVGRRMTNICVGHQTDHVKMSVWNLRLGQKSNKPISFILIKRYYQIIALSCGSGICYTFTSAFLSFL